MSCTADVWKRKSLLNSWAISRAKRWKVRRHQQVGGLLELTGLGQRDGTGTETVRLLGSSSGELGLPGSFGLIDLESFLDSEAGRSNTALMKLFMMSVALLLVPRRAQDPVPGLCYQVRVYDP